MRLCVRRMFNRIALLEYIPLNFRQSTQIPLYKGKNTCSLDQNNYRGITLLTSLNKVFEILVWERMKDCWEGEQVISPLQGACRPGKLCVHSSLILQESIAVGLGTKKKVLVTYLDVSKAFDGVWIDGLFFQLRKMGIRGRVWHMLYKLPKFQMQNTYMQLLLRLVYDGMQYTSGGFSITPEVYRIH